MRKRVASFQSLLYFIYIYGSGLCYGDLSKALVLMIAYMRIMRPKQWIKNLFVVAPLIFGNRISSQYDVVNSSIAFVSFCMASSCVYIVNDIFDADSDKKHPTKCNRPIPSGMVSIHSAIILALGLCIMLLLLMYVMLLRENALFSYAVIGFIILNLFYCSRGKHIVIVDAFCISIGFVLRVVGGAYAISVMPSSWILVTTLFLALFLGFGKRRNELVQLNELAGDHRAVLGNYDQALLDHLIMSTGTLAIISYALYTLDFTVIARIQSDKLSYTIPFVTYGIYRYMYLLRQDSEGDPTELVTRDISIIVSTMIWAVSVVTIAILGSHH